MLRNTESHGVGKDHLMQRNILQDLENLFCQKIVDLPSGYDLASFVHPARVSMPPTFSGRARTFKGEFIPSLRICDEYHIKLYGSLPSSCPRSPARLSLNQGSDPNSRWTHLSQTATSKS